jgi:hypothetical protein
MTEKSSVSADVPPEREESLSELVRGMRADLPAELVKQAVEQLMEAADAYRMEFTSRRGDRLYRPFVSEDRAVLSKILKPTQEALAALDIGLPFGARRALARAGLSDAAVKAKLAEVASVVRGALDSLAAIPNRVPDDPRAVLAFDVATVLADTLGIEPSLSRPSEINAPETALGARGAFHRLLEATLLAAGAVPPTDLMPWMRLGRQLRSEFGDSA